MTDISKGNIRTKYFAYANNCYLEMINATDAGAEAFCISYSFGSLSEEEIYSVFTDCLKTLGATDEEIEECIAAIKDGRIKIRFKAIFIDEVLKNIEYN